MTGRLAGQRAIITGGAQGIGRASVERFVAEGAQVLAVDINAAALAQLRTDVGCEICVLDLTSKTLLSAFIETTGDVDILLLCAGHVATGTILDCGDDEWAFSFELNVTAMFLMIRGILPRMIERRRGAIVTISSVASSVKSRYPG